MVLRNEYLEQLKAWRDEAVIKVVTGIRRCGKSTLLAQYRDFLIASGVGALQILSLNFEALEYEALQDYKSLYDYLCAHLSKDKMTYIFLDEVQKIEGFEKVVDSLYIKKNVDLYITGSNAYLLSGELATLLSGRYIEISMLPLSFAEYCRLKGSTATSDALLTDYMQDGAFPYVSLMDKTKEKVDMYLEGIYNTVLIKDIEDRQKRREKNANKRKVTDIALLKNISKFLASSIGNPVTVKRIADYITSAGRSVSSNTVSDYIEALEESYVFYPAERYDVLGKQTLKMNQKIYMVDLGLRRHLLPRSNYDLGFSLENLVYFELLRRSYKVSVGKVGATEVDFVAEHGGKTHYYQVTASLTDEKTFAREITPLKNIHDNYPKTILTLDRFTLGDYDGIEVVNAIDWMLEG